MLSNDIVALLASRVTTYARHRKLKRPLCALSIVVGRDLRRETLERHFTTLQMTDAQVAAMVEDIDFRYPTSNKRAAEMWADKQLGDIIRRKPRTVCLSCMRTAVENLNHVALDMLITAKKRKHMNKVIDLFCRPNMQVRTFLSQYHTGSTYDCVRVVAKHLKKADLDVHGTKHVIDSIAKLRDSKSPTLVHASLMLMCAIDDKLPLVPDVTKEFFKSRVPGPGVPVKMGANAANMIARIGTTPYTAWVDTSNAKSGLQQLLDNELNAEESERVLLPFMNRPIQNKKTDELWYQIVRRRDARKLTLSTVAEMRLDATRVLIRMYDRARRNRKIKATRGPPPAGV